MIREEILQIARLASQSAHNFTQDVYTTHGYDSSWSRNYYTTRDGKVRIDFEYQKAYVEVRVPHVSFWSLFTGEYFRWKIIELTEAEQALMNEVYHMLEQCFVRQEVEQKRAAEKAEKLAHEKAIVESEQTRLLRNVLKGTNGQGS